MDNVEQVRARDAARLQAMVEGRLDLLTSLLDPELIYVHSSGVADGKAAYLKAFGAGEYIYHELVVESEKAIEAHQVVVLNQMIRATMTLKAMGQTLTRTMVQSSVWRFRDAEWRLVLLHSTAKS